MNTIRREKIRQYVDEHGVATLPQLCVLCPGVSLMTIHRDLSHLEGQGLLVKIRGGARCVSDHSGEPAFAARDIVNRTAKQIIAGKALQFLQGHASVFIDAGTTMMAFARQVPDMQANVVTTGPNIALELAGRPSLAISLCGGMLNKSNLTLSGDAAVESLSHINIDIAFIAAAGYSKGAGFTCGMESEARIKRLVIQKARTRIMMMDSSKLEKLLPYTFADIRDFDRIITDLDGNDFIAFSPKNEQSE
ncbi:MAG: DeoR/GlpR family DNA-binding transcription regulator [Oscillospiraceae bacterium]|nr:DeoR/GlpR family DNA-binding transcription regulator [Oscillospiraceae bacterium]